MTAERKPNAAQRTILESAVLAGGYLEHVHDGREAERCVDSAWLVQEGMTGYAVTQEGLAVVAKPGEVDDHSKGERI